MRRRAWSMLTRAPCAVGSSPLPPLTQQKATESPAGPARQGPGIFTGTATLAPKTVAAYNTALSKFCAWWLLKFPMDTFTSTLRADWRLVASRTMLYLDESFRAQSLGSAEAGHFMSGLMNMLLAWNSEGAFSPDVDSMLAPLWTRRPIRL